MPMFTMKKKNAMNTGGMTASRSRGTARSARPAIVTMSCDEAARVAARMPRRARCAWVDVEGDVGQSVMTSASSSLGVECGRR